MDTPFVRFMIPSAEADDGCFTHSRQAFHGLVNLVGLKLYVDFPDYTDDCRKKDPQIGQAKTGSVDSLSVEQQAAALKNLGRHVEEIMVQPFIAARAPSSSQRYPLAALHFLFGRPSGICHAPVIGGGP